MKIETARAGSSWGFVVFFSFLLWFWELRRFSLLGFLPYVQGLRWACFDMPRKRGGEAG
jgi:hypothetical protein